MPTDEDAADLVDWVYDPGSLYLTDDLVRRGLLVRSVSGGVRMTEQGAEAYRLYLDQRIR